MYPLVASDVQSGWARSSGVGRGVEKGCHNRDRRENCSGEDPESGTMHLEFPVLASLLIIQRPGQMLRPLTSFFSSVNWGSNS